jgi:hypothetical protein
VSVTGVTRFLDLKGISASGRVEETRSFFKKIHSVSFLKKEYREYHAAAGDAAVQRVKHPV